MADIKHYNRPDAEVVKAGGSRFRIAIAGFQHETNTFGATTAGMNEFEMADSWPELLTGEDVITGTSGLNLPIAGFIAEAQKIPQIELLPVLWCAAEPCSYVEDEAYETIICRLIQEIRGFGPVDGIYLDLHGAMVTQSFEDGEGELLRRLRDEFGEDIPIAVSLDLHANISETMVEVATSMDLFRTYPHLDMAETGARCVPQILEQINGKKPSSAFARIPYLIPLHNQYTGAEPCASLYGLVEQECQENGVSAGIALGFTASDIHDAGPSVVAYADDQSEADRIVDRIVSAFVTAEGNFEDELLPPNEAVRTALQNTSGKPVVIADVQDNPGAGATSDTTGLLAALIEKNATGAVLGLMHDPEMAELAHKTGEQGIIEGALGGKSDSRISSPVFGRFRVEAISDGKCTYTGEMYGGGVAELGPCALLKLLDRQAEIRVVVSSVRSQCLDQALFRHLGVCLEKCRIICVKSTVHYRADFETISSEILETAAPGLFVCELEKMPYQNLRAGMRLGPGGPPFKRPEA